MGRREDAPQKRERKGGEPMRIKLKASAEAKMKVKAKVELKKGQKKANRAGTRG